MAFSIANLRIEGDLAIIPLRNGEVLLDAVNADAILAIYYIRIARNETATYVEAAHRKTRRGLRLSRVIMQPPRGMVVDHINGDTLDNRRANLRVVTSQANSRNRAKQSQCSSRYKGVCFVAGRWSAYIYSDYKQYRLGRFTSETEAAAAYDAAARERFGECAALNFPKVGEQSAHRRSAGSSHSATISDEGQNDHGL